MTDRHSHVWVARGSQELSDGWQVVFCDCDYGLPALRARARVENVGSTEDNMTDKHNHVWVATGSQELPDGRRVVFYVCDCGASNDRVE